MSARGLAFLALLGPAAVLGAALVSQFIGGLAPCPMCVWQRWPHVAAIVLAAVALALGPGENRGRTAGGALTLGALALLAGAGLGAFHAGVELNYWEGPTSCSGGGVGELSTDDLVSQIMEASLVRCDEVAWSFLGVSMAGWNAICSVVLAGLTAVAARAHIGGRRGR